MSKSFDRSTLSILAIIAVIIVLGIGWVMNIIALAHMASVFTGMGILRIVGIFVAPLGSVLGFL